MCASVSTSVTVFVSVCQRKFESVCVYICQHNLKNVCEYFCEQKCDNVCVCLQHKCGNVCVCVCEHKTCDILCVCVCVCEHKTCDIVCESVSTKRATLCVSVNTKRDIVCVSVSTKRATLSMCEPVSTSTTMSVVVACKDFTEGQIRDRCTFRIHGKQNPPKTIDCCLAPTHCKPLASFRWRTPSTAARHPPTANRWQASDGEHHRLLPGTHPLQTAGKLQMANTIDCCPAPTHCKPLASFRWRTGNWPLGTTTTKLQARNSQLATL